MSPDTRHQTDSEQTVRALLTFIAPHRHWVSCIAKWNWFQIHTTTTRDQLSIYCTLSVTSYRCSGLSSSSSVSVVFIRFQTISYNHTLTAPSENPTKKILLRKFIWTARRALHVWMCVRVCEIWCKPAKVRSIHTRLLLFILSATADTQTHECIGALPTPIRIPNVKMPATAPSECHGIKPGIWNALEAERFRLFTVLNQCRPLTVRNENEIRINCE